MEKSKQSAPAAVVAEYVRLSDIMRQSVYRVDFPFGVVGPTRRRMDEIERRYVLPVDRS